MERENGLGYKICFENIDLALEDIVVFYPIILHVNKDEIQNINGVLLEIN